MDRFLANRIIRLVEKFRAMTGELPTVEDFEAQGVDRKVVDLAERSGVIEKFYVTLTTGVIKKGYKVSSKVASKP